MSDSFDDDDNCLDLMAPYDWYLNNIHLDLGSVPLMNDIEIETGRHERNAFIQRSTSSSLAIENADHAQHWDECGEVPRDYRQDNCSLTTNDLDEDDADEQQALEPINIGNDLENDFNPNEYESLQVHLHTDDYDDYVLLEVEPFEQVHELLHTPASDDILASAASAVSDVLVQATFIIGFYTTSRGC